jgi:hypothetical protein
MRNRLYIKLRNCVAVWFLVAVCRAKQKQLLMSTGITADNLSEAGWSWGYVSAIDSNGRTIWIADAHRDDGKRFVVRADEKLTPFVELESAIRGCRILLTSRRDFFKTR